MDDRAIEKSVNTPRVRTIPTIALNKSAKQEKIEIDPFESVLPSPR